MQGRQFSAAVMKIKLAAATVLLASPSRRRDRLRLSQRTGDG
jgi:hypothetical protein